MTTKESTDGHDDLLQTMGGMVLWVFMGMEPKANFGMTTIEVLA